MRHWELGFGEYLSSYYHHKPQKTAMLTAEAAT